MTVEGDIPRIAMQVSRGVIVASIQVDLREEVLIRFREDLLDRIHQTSSRGVILDVSGLGILDSDEFWGLRQTVTMATLLGADAVLAGLQPGVVSALVESGVDVDGLQTSIDIDAAFELLLPTEDGEVEDDTPLASEGDSEGLPESAESLSGDEP